MQKHTLFICTLKTLMDIINPVVRNDHWNIVCMLNLCHKMSFVVSKGEKTWYTSMKPIVHLSSLKPPASDSNLDCDILRVCLSMFKA